MKRKLIGLLCVCMLLSGCGIGSSKPLQTESPPTESLQAHLPLLEQGIALEESSNLRYIPNAAVECMTAPEVRLLGNGLLLSECVGNELVLKHFSLENGALVKEGSVPACPGTKLYIGSGEIGLCDQDLALISILDEDLHLLRTYEVPQVGDEWYLNSELNTLYVFFYDRGLLARSLETGEERWLVDNGFRVTPIGNGTGHLIFEYTDREDQKTYTRCLNLSTVAMETLPVGSTISAGTRQGETWLLQSSETHLLVQGENACAFICENSAARLLSPRRHLLVTDSSGRNLM